MLGFFPDDEFTVEFVGACVATCVVGVILLTGWLTRAFAVVVLSIGLAVMASLVLGATLFIRIGAGDGFDLSHLVAFRLVAGVAGILVLLAIWALVRLWRAGHGRVVLTNLTPSSDRHSGEYDRTWLLSLLQQRQASAGERVSIAPAGCSKEPSTDPARKA